MFFLVIHSSSFVSRLIKQQFTSHGSCKKPAGPIFLSWQHTPNTAYSRPYYILTFSLDAVQTRICWSPIILTLFQWSQFLSLTPKVVTITEACSLRDSSHFSLLWSVYFWPRARSRLNCHICFTCFLEWIIWESNYCENHCEIVFLVLNHISLQIFYNTLYRFLLCFFFNKHRANIDWS